MDLLFVSLNFESLFNLKLLILFLFFNILLNIIIEVSRDKHKKRPQRGPFNVSCLTYFVRCFV